MSKRARKAALARESAKLFPPGFWDIPAPTIADKRAALIRRADTLDGLADRGMGVRKHRREAERLRQAANELEEKNHERNSNG